MRYTSYRKGGGFACGVNRGDREIDPVERGKRWGGKDANDGRIMDLAEMLKNKVGCIFCRRRISLMS